MGFTAVSNVGTGVYCLTPAAGVDPSKYPAVAVGEWGNSGAAMPYVAMVYNLGLDCSTGQYEILAGHGTSGLADDVAFNVIVP